MQRAGAPVFNVLVELLTQTEWRVHLNVAKSVDAMLSNKEVGMVQQKEQKGEACTLVQITVMQIVDTAQSHPLTQPMTHARPMHVSASAFAFFFLCQAPAQVRSMDKAHGCMRIKYANNEVKHAASVYTCVSSRTNAFRYPNTARATTHANISPGRCSALQAAQAGAEPSD